ncbi:MAG: hypothetical protein UT90_C0014G0007 [Parcubacteria group bacterium GW2011_GWA1_40_21]|nr:MAG: hypothetical protein UT80_C0013G0005 [Parcubacteria group bacterium GW2011_GWC1_40_13]KKR53122.1 MAG: hypothetical protein UT90_C0014G0007 [Parcubacteria group bacterium GW2011_GWA1_40_21]
MPDRFGLKKIIGLCYPISGHLASNLDVSFPSQIALRKTLQIVNPVVV